MNFINKDKGDNMTESEKIKLLSDPTKTNKQLAEMMNCSPVTISRHRKKYGIVVPSGLKPGQHNNKIVKYKVNCVMCGHEFYTVPSSMKQKHCSKKCMYKNKDYIESLKNVNKSYMQTMSYRSKLMKDDTPEYMRYRNRVTRLSEQTYKENQHILNPNNHVRTICGVENGYQLDHKISVRKCFDSGLTPEEASRLENLQMLPWKTNLLKGK